MPALGRRVEFDERSKAYPVRSIVPPDITRGRSHYCKPVLDQGSVPACVGFSWAHELAAFPYPVPVTNKTGLQLYEEAKDRDQWPGDDYEGSSVLGGAKAVKDRGFIKEYRWCFGVDDVLRALAFIGPVVFGTDWLDGMFRPRPSGLLEVEGSSAGGHAYLARGFLLKPRIGEPNLGPIIRFRNSWGDWARDGDFFMKVEDVERLLKDDGEACVPLGRSY